MELTGTLKLRSAGFDWSTPEYKVDSTDTDDANEDNDEHDESEVVRPQIDERTYLILAQRYKELFYGNSSCGGDSDDGVKNNPKRHMNWMAYLTEINDRTQSIPIT